MSWCGLIFTLLVNFRGHTTELAYSRNARTFEVHQSGLLEKGMAHACLTISNLQGSLPCNPAMTPRVATPNLSVSGLLSNGDAALTQMRDILVGNPSDQVIDELFADGQIKQVEVNSEINFSSPYLNGRFTPFLVKGFSVVRNEANPEVELSIYQENNFIFQSGYQISKNFLVGGQFRFIERKFVRENFKLIELATEQGKRILSPKTENLVFFDPGLFYQFEANWSPKFSAMIVNIGNKKENAEFAEPVEVQIGLGVSPPIPIGSLDLSLDYRSLSYEEDFVDRIHLGSIYRFGALVLVGGIDSSGLSAGVLFGIDQINAGVLYTTTKLVSNNEFFSQAVYVQMGCQI